MKLKISGGPACNNMKVMKVLDDGSELELKNIAKMKISEFAFNKPITVEMTFVNVELQLELETEVIGITE